MGRSGSHVSLDRAQHTRKIDTFSWEAGNPVMAREHFFNEVLGWLVLSTRLCRNDKFMGTRHSLETDKKRKRKKVLKQPISKERSKFIHRCAMFPTICWQLKQSVLWREQRYFCPEGTS